MEKSRLYGKYEPVSKEMKDLLEKVYMGKEETERNIAYEIAADSTIINQELLFAGATSINDAYMLRNTHEVPLVNGDKIRSLKLRDFNDDEIEEEVKDYIMNNQDKISVVAYELNEKDIDKRKNFTLKKPLLCKINEGKYAGLCFGVGEKTLKTGEVKSAIFIDIANTPFDKLPSSWQNSNFDPFEFAYKLVIKYGEKLTEDQLAAIIHVYWLNGNKWAIDYNDPMAVPYCELTRVEQVKDIDNAIVGEVYHKQTKDETNINQEKCKDIIKITKRILEENLRKEKEQINNLTIQQEFN